MEADRGVQAASYLLGGKAEAYPYPHVQKKIVKFSRLARKIFFNQFF